MPDSLRLSRLGHTWILDLDGTLVRHNGYRLDGHDSFLPGAREFLRRIPRGDMVLFLTSRPDACRDLTERFLTENEVRFDRIVYNAPVGERILLNDRKPSGLATALAVNVGRDDFGGLDFVLDDGL